MTSRALPPVPEQNNAARDFTLAVKLRDAAAHFRPQTNLSDVAQNRRRSRCICFGALWAEVVKRLPDTPERAP